MMHNIRDFLGSSGFSTSDGDAAPSSGKRFPDGAQYRVEIPSVEGPEVLAEVLAEADARGVEVHRISQGSGGMLMTDDELSEMAGLAASRGIEVSLFARPLAGWGTSAAAMASGGGSLGAQARGTEQLVACLADIERSAAAGIRSVLVTDIGVLDTAAKMRAAGLLPAEFQFKVSVQMGLANPASIRIAESLDVYIEAPDDMGGFVRHFEIAEIVRVAAPVYVKFGLRNAPNIYPSGTHLTPTAVALGRERVRRARIGLDLLARLSPDAVASKLPVADLAVPVPERLG
jgi:hypothetical protein